MEDKASAGRVAELEQELEALRAQLHTSTAEVGRMQGLLQESGAKRDSLTLELKSKTEDAASLQQVLNCSHSHSHWGCPVRQAGYDAADLSCSRCDERLRFRLHILPIKVLLDVPSPSKLENV